MLSAGVIPVRRERDQWLLLMLRAYQYWDFPKGRTEAGETPLQAALREVEEETGLHDLDFRWGYDFVETGPYARGKLARYYIAETRSDKVVMGIAPELGRPEHHEYRWVDYDHAYALAAPRVRRVLEWAKPRLFDA
ncbi:NUDIX hydrolase [Alkalilimnicola ehrlichii]|uniref:NUDIX hydrolase n=1 Tax=Alkalilimnicola ehrlichii TaxID=351052 RepID=A0A3E0X1W1_9GAMM|nr:NUDIX hydrolase [Alkalilimnicola ehrlichii]RFA39649.1 NUDIX hydrolase [Alkalilimnicola ehrlichii]